MQVLNPGGSVLTPINGTLPSDPYMSLAAPTGSPAPAPILNSGTYTYFPGVYTSQVSISATNAVFTSGIYIFEGGIQVQGASTLTSSPGGVLFYVTGSTSAVLFSSSSVTFNLQPLASPPSPAPNLVIWQDVSDTTQMKLQGGATGSIINGTIYAPGAQVYNDSSTLNVGAIQSNSIACSGGSASYNITGS